jgi:predicted metal-binding protein
MFEASLIKCINCDIFYELNNFFEKDIKSMRENHKLIYCKKCINNAENINKKK